MLELEAAPALEPDTPVTKAPAAMTAATVTVNCFVVLRWTRIFPPVPRPFAPWCRPVHLALRGGPTGGGGQMPAPLVVLTTGLTIRVFRARFYDTRVRVPEERAGRGTEHEAR